MEASRELYQVFPDLVPLRTSDQNQVQENYYALLEVECDVNPSMVNAAYLKKVKKFLRQHPNPEVAKDEYYTLLNAGFVLRKPRLRLSHDLLVCKAWLDEQEIGPEDVESYEADTHGDNANIVDFTPPPPVVSENGGVGGDLVPCQWRTMEERLPMLIDLLKATQLIGPAEVQALKNQMLLYTDIPLVDLVLQAGYVTDLEMKSLQLAADYDRPILPGDVRGN